MDVARLLLSAEQAARAAGVVLAERFHGERTIAFKGGIDLVTDADHASEKLIVDQLLAEYPDHAILAEERGAQGKGDYTWVIDPLDGTTNYAHQVPQFCVSIAVLGPGGVLAGAVYDPMRGELFSAGRGKGAHLNGRRLHASAAGTIGLGLLCTGFPYDVRENPDAPVGLFNRMIRQAQGIRRMGAAALDLAYVAAGRFDGFFEFGLKPWDLAAGALLVEEAGGKMTRIDGAPLELSCGDVLAAGPAIAEPLQHECSAFLREIHWKPRRTVAVPGEPFP